MQTGQSRRRSLRRAVALECGAQHDVWDGVLAFRATDLSNEGLWLDTPYPLTLGEELVLSFVPPGAKRGDELWALAEVARVGLWRRRWDPFPTGMGLTFTYFSAVDRRFLARSLLGRPPRLPGRRRPPPLPSARTARVREPMVLGLADVVFDGPIVPALPPVLEVALAERDAG